MDQPVVELEWPRVGEKYVDRVVPNRALHVREIRRGDSAGRNVVGVVTDGLIASHHGDPYACDLQVFHAVWRKA